MNARNGWAKRAGRIVVLLLLAELVFFFVLGTRIRKKLESPREVLGHHPARASTAT
jgi:hypothetical protein